jgi:hypothetical protein
LFALNSPFILQQADALGRWLQAQESQDAAGKVRAAYARLFQRHPTDAELGAAQRFLTGREGEAATWSQYAQALLVGNEMLFVD